MAQIKYDRAGNAWDVSSGTPVLVRQAAPPAITTHVAPPAYPYEGPQAATNLQRSQVETRNAELTSAATVAKTKAEAQKAQIDAQTAQEQWNINHPQANGTEGLSGPAYMQWLQKNDPGRAAYIQGLAEGRVPFPGAQMMRSPAGQALLTQVMRADPTIDATNYTTRAAARKNAATGNLSQSDNALVTAIGHAARLHSLVPDVFGSPVTPFNALANTVQANLLNGKQPAYEQNAQLLGDEVAKAYGAGTGSERGATGSQFSSSLSSDQKNTNIRGAIDLMLSKLAANRAQFAYGNGQLAKPDFMLLPQNVRDELQQAGASDLAKKYFAGVPVMGENGGPDGTIGGGPDGGAGGPPPTDPTAPATGPTRTEITRGPVEKRLAAMLAGGAPADQVKAFAQQNGFTKNLDSVLAWRALHPTYKGGYDVSTESVVPTTTYQRAAASPLAAAIVGAGDAATMGLGDEAIGAVNALKNGGSLGDNIASANYSKQLLESANPNASLLGNVVGGTGAMIGGGLGLRALLAGGAKGGLGRDALAWAARNPIKAAALGDTAYGAGYGAGENNDNRALGAGVGAAVAPVASMLGSGLTNAAGSVIGGIANPAVRRLSDAGIPLTAGEALGGGWKKAQDAFTHVFGPGDMIARRYADGRRALNELGYNTAGDVIGTPINEVGQKAINKLDAAKSNAFSNALDPISLNLNDPKFIGSMQGALDAADAIPGAELPEGYGGVSIRHYVGNQVSPDGTMTGEGFQRAYRGLAQTANKSAPKIEGYDIGQAVGQAKDALTTALQEQNPGAYDAFLKANAANRMLNILAKAQNAAKNQITDGGEALWTPAQLGTAATDNAIKYGSPIAAAGGNRPFNQLINDAQQVMSSKVPDSGSAGRILATKLAATAGVLGGSGGLGYGANGGEGAVEGGLGGALALSLGGSKIAQQAITAALMKRTLADQIAARGLKRNPTVGGNLLASLGIPLLDSPTP